MCNISLQHIRLTIIVMETQWCVFCVLLIYNVNKSDTEGTALKTQKCITFVSVSHMSPAV